MFWIGLDYIYNWPYSAYLAPSLTSSICLTFPTYSKTFLCITASSTNTRALITQYRIADLQPFLGKWTVDSRG